MSLEAVNWLKKIYGKFLIDQGILIAGLSGTTAVKLTCTPAGRLQVDVGAVTATIPNIDVLLSTRATQVTAEASRVLLDELTDALASVGTDSLQTVSI